MEKPTCESCPYYLPREESKEEGDCCRYPVSLKGKMETKSKDWCGEHPEFISWLSKQRRKEKGVLEDSKKPEIDSQDFQRIFMDVFKKSLNGLKKRELSENEVDVSFPGIILENGSYCGKEFPFYQGEFSILRKTPLTRATGINIAFDPESSDHYGYFFNKEVNLEPDPISKEFERLAQLDVEEERKAIAQEVEEDLKGKVTKIRCNGKKVNKEIEQVKELIRETLMSKTKSISPLQNS